MNFGLPQELHSIKVEPFTLRLTSVTKALNDAVEQKNRKLALYFLEDTSFWMGRVTCDTIGAAEGAQDFKQYRTAAFAVMNAAEAIARAKSFLTPSKPPLGAMAGTAGMNPFLLLVIATFLLYRP